MAKYDFLKDITNVQQEEQDAPVNQPEDFTIGDYQSELDKLKSLRDQARSSGMAVRGSQRIADALARGYGGKGAVDPNIVKEMQEPVQQDIKGLKEKLILSQKAKEVDAKKAKDERDQELFGKKLDKLGAETELIQAKTTQALREKQAEKLDILKQAKAKKIMSDLKTGKERANPNSLLSKEARKMLQEKGQQVNEELSYTQIKDLGLISDKQMSEYQKERLDLKKERLDLGKRREERLTDKHAFTKEEKYEDDARKTLKDLRQTETWKSSEKTLSEVPTLKTLLDDAYTKGGQSLAMLGPKVARSIAGEVGVLTEQDVVRYVKNPEIVGGALDALKKASEGKITEVTYENLKRLLDISEQEAGRKMKQAVSREAELFSRRSGIKRDQAMYLLNEQYKPAEKKQESKKEIKRITKDGRAAIFDENKKFLRYEDK